VWLRPTVVTSPQRSKSPESSISCSTGDAFPHHSRAIPELPNPFQEAEFSRLRQARSICRISRIAILTEKPEQGSAGGNSEMRARPEIREILISRKMRRWSMIAQHPFVDLTCQPSQARRNFLRLLALPRYCPPLELDCRLGVSAYLRVPHDQQHR
jgi:hypothetical protein